MMNLKYEMFSTSDENTSISSEIQSILFYLISVIVTCLILSIGLVTSTNVTGYHLQNVHYSVNKTSCTCDCWDGFYRGLHSRGGYKIFYFNYEKSMIIILIIILFYGELLRRTLVNFFCKRSWNFFLFIPSIYSHFYGVWSLINYLNDFDYNRMLKSQIYFSFTELIASYLFYQCLMSRNQYNLSITSIYLLLTISCLHIILAAGELNIERLGRNINIILSDLIAFIWIINLFVRYDKFRPNRRLILRWLCVAVFLWISYHIFFPFNEKRTK